MQQQPDRARHMKNATDLSEAMRVFWAKPNSRPHRRHIRLQDVKGFAPRVIVWDWNETETAFEPGYDRGNECVFAWRRTKDAPEIIESFALEHHSVGEIVLHADRLMNKAAEQWARVGKRP